MSMVINTNVSSLTAQRHLAESRLEMEQAMERLSSGKRINSAMDDAAGLTIAHTLDAKIQSLGQAVRNANDGIAMLNLAEGGLDEVSAMLTRMKELATQSINGTYQSSNDRSNMNLEFEQLTTEITRISENTFFNGVKLLNTGDSVKFQLGDTSSDRIDVTLERTGAAWIGAASGFSVTSLAGTLASTSAVFTLSNAIATTANDIRLEVAGKTFVVNGGGGTAAATTAAASFVTALAAAGFTASNTGAVLTVSGLSSGQGSLADLDYYARTSSAFLESQNISSATNAGSALTVIDRAIAQVDTYRAKLGAYSNRMEHAASNLLSRVEHQSAARSRIQDADYAVESANLAKAQVLQQADTAMLAQANASSQNILSLLK